MVVEWRDIPGYEGLYKASSCGSIKSNRKYKGSRRRKSLILKPGICKALSNSVGYYKVKLHKDSVGKDFIVSRLVAMAFIPNPESKPQVNHKDGDTLNNVVSNLEWVTCAENHAHAYETGLKETNQGRGGNAKFLFRRNDGLAFIGTPWKLCKQFPYEGDHYRIVTHEEECSGWNVDWTGTLNMRKIEEGRVK